MPNQDKVKKNKTNLEYYYRHKERILIKLAEQQKIKYHENKKIYLERSKRSREKHYEKQLLRSAKNRAKKDGLEFDIDVTDIIIPDNCPYLKIPLTRIQGQGKIWSNASIDRIDNSKGYVKGNVEIISLKANVMKNHATYEELINFAKTILGHL